MRRAVNLSLGIFRHTELYSAALRAAHFSNIWHTASDILPQSFPVMYTESSSCLVSEHEQIISFYGHEWVQYFTLFKYMAVKGNKTTFS